MTVRGDINITQVQIKFDVWFDFKGYGPKFREIPHRQFTKGREGWG